MKIIYNRFNKSYCCADINNNWYPSGRTMLEAITNAIKNLEYWDSITPLK